MKLSRIRGDYPLCFSYFLYPFCSFPSFSSLAFLLPSLIFFSFHFSSLLYFVSILFFSFFSFNLFYPSFPVFFSLFLIFSYLLFSFSSPFSALRFLIIFFFFLFSISLDSPPPSLLIPFYFTLPSICLISLLLQPDVKRHRNAHTPLWSKVEKTEKNSHSIIHLPTSE